MNLKSLLAHIARCRFFFWVRERPHLTLVEPPSGFVEPEHPP